MHRNLYRRASLESLEFRRLLSLTVATPLPDITVPGTVTSASISLANTFTSSDLAGDTIVQMQIAEWDTTVTPNQYDRQNIDLQLYNSQAPITVANFLSYVNSGAYNDTIFYRADPGFVIQTGADYPVDAEGNPVNLSSPGDTTVGTQGLPTPAPTIQNEYSDSRPNILGTIAMGNVTGDPNNASTEWFINLADNSEKLDTQNSGFTVFGQVVNGGMTVAQAIGNLPTLAVAGASGPGSDLPLVNYTSSGGPVELDNLVLVPTVSVIPGISYAVSSSNSAVVNPSVSGSSLSLTYGQAGTAKVTVTATDVFGNTQTDSFNVSVPYSATVGSPTSNKPKTFTYTDANGTLTTVTLKGVGTLTPSFSSGTALVQSQIKNGTAFSGSNLVLEDLQIESTNAESSVTITTKFGNGKDTIEGLSANSPINTITAKDTILTGNVSFTSAKSLTADSTSNAIVTGQALSKLALTDTSSFSMTLSGALGTFTEKGAMINSVLTAASVKSVSAASMTNDTIQAGNSASTFPPAGSDLTAGASIGSIKDKGVFANTDLIAASLGTISIGPITTDNDNNVFGLAGDSLKSFSALENGKKVRLTKITSANAATVTAANSGDFEIDIL
jgi:cyclophilin family peptidyl-prolyl cis-trans isomerase